MKQQLKKESSWQAQAKSKNSFGEYYENLHQAKPATSQYETWTKHIEKEVRKSPLAAEQNTNKPEDITAKKIEKAIKKLKTKKPRTRWHTQRSIHKSKQANEWDSQRSH